MDRLRLTTYNLLGEIVKEDEIRASAGLFRYAYDGSSLVSGLYFLQVKAGSFSTTQKLMVIR